MSQLDHHRTLERLDPLGIAHTAERLGEQLRAGWEAGTDCSLPRMTMKVENIVICGMGGSALAGEIFCNLAEPVSKKPLHVVRDYTVPAYVNASSLVIIMSTSGTTEEMIALHEQAKKRKAKILICAGGGPLAKTNLSPAEALLLLEAKEYGDPRYITAYLLGVLLAVGDRLKVLSLTKQNIAAMVRACNDVVDTCAPDVPEEENPAKQIATALANQHVIILGAEHLQGNAHTLANHLNETAKQRATWSALPEFHHHALESFLFPKEIPDSSAVVLLTSPCYSTRLQERCGVTADLLEDMGCTVVEYQTGGGTAAEEVAEVLTLGCYVSWYTAVLHGIETGDLPYVTLFKKSLGPYKNT